MTEKTGDLKSGFVLYFDNYPALAALSMEQRGVVLTALFAYGDRLRRGVEEPLEELLEQPPQEPPDGGDLQQQVLDRMCRQELARAVQRLEEKYRSPVILMYRFGMGIDEIARIERVPKGTIKSRLSRARKQLRKEMEERGYAQEF